MKKQDIIDIAIKVAKNTDYNVTYKDKPLVIVAQTPTPPPPPCPTGYYWDEANSACILDVG